MLRNVLFTQSWTNLPLHARLFGRATLFAYAKKGAQSQIQCAHLIEKQLETIIFVLCSLNRADSFHFYCNSIKIFCNGPFAVLVV